MSGVASAQGTSVSFASIPIGFLTGFDVDAKSGSLVETTHVESAVVGEGVNARVVKQYDATAVEPPTISIQFWGAPSFDWTDCGLKAQIVFSGPDDVITGEAVLLSWNHSGKAGQYTTGTATFQLTGNLE